jgi:hypothetical protein
MHGYTGITFFADEDSLGLINLLICGGEIGSGKFKMAYLVGEDRIDGFDWGYSDAVDSEISLSNDRLEIEFTHIGGMPTAYFDYLSKYLGSIEAIENLEIYMRTIDTERECFSLYSYKDGNTAIESFVAGDKKEAKKFLKNVKIWFGENWKEFGEEIHFEELQEGKNEPRG